MTTRACKRCQKRPGIAQTRTAIMTTDIVEQVCEITSICRPCRSDADAENRRATWRTSQGWTDAVDLKDLFW